MKTTKILTAATILALPMLGACDSSPTGPVVEDEIFAAPQMGLGTSPISSDGKGVVVYKRGVITKVQPSGKGGIIG